MSLVLIRTLSLRLFPTVQKAIKISTAITSTIAIIILINKKTTIAN